MIFKSTENYGFFLRRFSDYVLPFVELYAYCLMPTHFHFFIRHKSEEEIVIMATKGFKNLFISYAKAYNKMYDRHGSVFQPKYKKKVVADDDYITNVIQYIHCNPLKDKLVRKLNDWEHSSYPEIIGDNNTVVEKNKVIEWFGGIQNFKEFHENALF